jgi:hypothetical protein
VRGQAMKSRQRKTSGANVGATSSNGETVIGNGLGKL